MWSCWLTDCRTVCLFCNHDGGQTRTVDLFCSHVGGQTLELWTCSVVMVSDRP